MDIGYVMPKKDWEGICTPRGRKLKCSCTEACTLLGLKNMTTYKRVKSATVGPVTNTYLELTMLCLFYFVLEREKIGTMSGLQWYLRNNSIFPL